MAFVPLRNIGKGGLVPDQAPYDVELTQFPSGNNVTFDNGTLGKTLGQTDVIAIPTKPVTVESYFNTGANNIFIGARNKIYRYNGTAVSDVTRTTDGATYSNTSKWQGEQIGSGFIFNNSADAPQFITKTVLASNGNFANLTHWPANLVTKSVKPYKSFLVMAGYTETAEYNTRVRWSDEYDPSSIPNDYDVASTTNLAGFTELGAENGDLVDQLVLGNTNVIYAERGVYAMDFIGAPLVFSFRELFTDEGIINRGACAAFEAKHLVVGRNDIYVHDGSSKASVANLKVKNEFFNDVVDTETIFCHVSEKTSEVWICYADNDAVKDATDTEYSPNRALIYNWSTNAFTFRDIPNARSMTNADIMSSGGNIGTWSEGGDGASLLNYDTNTSWWSNSSADSSSSDIVFFAVDHVTSKLVLMNDSRGFSGSNIDCFLEAPKLDLDTVLQTSTNTIKQINSIMPQMQGTGNVTFKIGSSSSPSGAVVFTEEKVFNVETDHKIDFRTSGRYLALRIESSNNSGFWNITGLDLDVREVAKR